MLQGSDTSPDIQGIGNNNVDYDIDSITLSPLYTGGGTMFLTGGELTVDNEILNNSAEELEFNSIVHLGDQFLDINANIGNLDFDAAVAVSLAGSSINATGGGNIFFDGGIARANAGLGFNDTTLQINGGTFVRLGGNSIITAIGQVNVINGTLQLNAVNVLPNAANVNVSSG